MINDILNGEQAQRIFRSRFVSMLAKKSVVPSSSTLLAAPRQARSHATESHFKRFLESILPVRLSCVCTKKVSC